MFKFDLRDEVIFKTYEGIQRRGIITERICKGRYMQPYYRVMSGMIIYTDIMESMIEFETPKVEKPVKLSNYIGIDKDGFLTYDNEMYIHYKNETLQDIPCGKVISGVRSGKDETHANSLFDKESEDRIMKLMGNREIKVMNGTEDLLKYLKDVKPIDTRGFNYFHYGLEDKKPLALTPSKVFFNDKKKATTLMFGETSTVVKCGKGDKYDRRIGFLEAYFQATCNMSKNKALKYLNEIVKDKEEVKKKEVKKEETKVEEKPNETKE